MNFKKIKIIFTIILFVLLIYNQNNTYAHQISSITSVEAENAGWNVMDYHRGTKNFTYLIDSTASTYSAVIDNGIALWGNSITMTKVESGQYEGIFILNIEDHSDHPYAQCPSTISNGHTTGFTCTIYENKFKTLDTIYKEEVIAHEVGHPYGLKHVESSNNEDKIMHKTSLAATSPHARDILGMEVVTGTHVNHTFSTYKTISDTQHVQECSYCFRSIANNHNFQWIKVFDLNGKDIGHVMDCVNCHARKDSNVHTWSVWENVGAPGEQQHCIICNLSIQTRPHDFNVSWLYGQQPTCTGNGIKVYDCKNCQYEYQEVVQALGHNWQPATCTSPSICSRCSVTTGSSLGHNYGSWYTTSNPTCTSSGIERHDCLRTGCTSYETRSISSLGHNFGNWYTTISPTCTQDGMERHNCLNSGCTSYETRSISALGHDWQYESYEAAHPHYNYDRCSRCQATSRGSDTYPWGSYWEGWYQTASPSCTQDGQMRRDAHCNVCYDIVDIDYSSIPATGHSWSWVTYTSSKDSGSCPYRVYWEDEKCSVCGTWHWVDRSYSVYEGHDWGSWYYSYFYFDYNTYEHVEVYYRNCLICNTSDYMEERY